MSSVRSSIGKKVLMAASGLILFGFVVGHLAGNLLIFAGPDALNGYARKLRHLGLGLWVVRGLLLASVGVHIWTSLELSIENRRARPVPYRRYRPAETTLAARTMMLSGVLVLAYLVYHLLHFTFHVTNPGLAHLPDPLGGHDVYTMMVLSFQHRAISLAYLVGVGMVCAHLSHGVASAFQTLGLNNERTLTCVERAGRAMAWGIFVGYASIPLSVLFGLIEPRTFP